VRLVPLSFSRFALIAAICLAGCETPPAVADFNGDSVKIRVSTFATAAANTPEAQSEATRICQTRNRRAEFTSILYVSDYYKDLLYLCL